MGDWGRGPDEERPVLVKDLPLLQTKPLAEKQLWLSAVTLARDSAAALAAQNTLEQERRGMANWLRTGTVLTLDTETSEEESAHMHHHTPSHTTDPTQSAHEGASPSAPTQPQLPPASGLHIRQGSR